MTMEKLILRDQTGEEVLCPSISMRSLQLGDFGIVIFDIMILVLEIPGMHFVGFAKKSITFLRRQDCCHTLTENGVVERLDAAGAVSDTNMK